LKLSSDQIYRLDCDRVELENRKKATLARINLISVFTFKINLRTLFFVQALLQCSRIEGEDKQIKSLVAKVLSPLCQSSNVHL